MIGRWESDDIQISLDATDVFGEYIIEAKWSENDQGKHIRDHYLHERSIGIITSLGQDSFYTYNELEPKRGEEEIDSTTYGYFASWAKSESVDENQNHSRRRKWILNKRFPLTKIVNDGELRGALTTDSLRVYNVNENLDIDLYNSEESELFDYILSHSTLEIYGRYGILQLSIESSGSEHEKLKINNRDYLNSLLSDDSTTYRVGIWGTYHKGNSTMNLQDVISPDSLPSDLSAYKSIREYILDQANSYQIFDSDIDYAELGIWKYTGSGWVRYGAVDTGYCHITASNISYRPYDSNSTDGIDDFFDYPVEIRMLPCSVYPQFHINDKCLVKINSLITPFSSYFPYEYAKVENFRKINDSTAALDVQVRSLSVGELEIGSSFQSEVVENSLYSSRPGILYRSIAEDLGSMESKIYFDDEFPVTLERDDLYMSKEPLLAYRNGPSFSVRSEIFRTGAMLNCLYTMGARSMRFPLERRVTLYLPYSEHVTGEILIRRNGVTVGSVPVDEIDYNSSFYAVRINNDVDVDVSCIVPVEENGSITNEVRNATLYGRFYDHTRIKFSDNSGIDIDPNDAINNMIIIISECIGSDRKRILFNMGSRKIVEERVEDDPYEVSYIDTEELVDEPVFYDNRLTKNEETGEYELSIFIAAKREDGKGFNDCDVKIAFTHAIDGSDIGTSTLRYRSSLPPFIIQGRPYKADPYDEDPVFPNSASRPDIGYDEESDSYVIPSYSENSQKYGRDFFFTNGDPEYSIETSGYMPSDLSEYYSFSEVSANIINDKTGSKYNLQLSEYDGEEHDIPVMKEGSDVYYGSFKVPTWICNLSSVPDSVFKNVVNVSAIVAYNDEV